MKQQVAATEHSVCTCRVTSCSNKSWQQITPSVQVGEQVAATSLSNRSLCLCRSGDNLQQQVMATDNSVCAGWATSCSNTLLRNIPATNGFVYVYSRILVKKSLSLQQNLLPQQVAQILSDLIFCDMLPRHVAATSHLVCTNLSTYKKYSSLKKPFCDKLLHCFFF